MKLFESTWRTKFEFFERYYCTVQNKSISKRINLKYEWYEPQSKGLYSSILDDSIKLEKKQGSAKQGRDNYGFLDPMYRNIRDNYWSTKQYNSEPRVWHLDIETRVSRSYKHPVHESQKIKVRKLGTALSVDTCTETSIVELRNALYDGSEETFEYFNELTKTWDCLNTSLYFQRNTGFPVPEKALEPISLMQFFDTKENVMFILGLKDWKHESDYEFDYPVKYIKCNNEIHMLEVYLGIFAKLDPLIIYAWAGAGFDFPYIHNRMKKLGMDTSKLSNYGDVKYSEGEYKGKMEYKFSADGHYYIDMLVVYDKFTFKPVPNLKLDTIAEIELKEKKVDHSEYAAFDDFYTGKYIIPDNPTDEQKNTKIYKAAINGDWAEVKELAHSEFVYYGAIDTHLIKRIDDKKNFTTLQIMIAEKMGVQIGDAMGTVKPWAQFISNKSHQNMKILPPKMNHEDPSVIGGYVRECMRGKHNWVLSADVNSMYPLLGMVGFNMSPETYIPISDLPPELRDIVLTYFNSQDEGARLELPDDIWNATTSLLNKHNMSLGINGAVFSKDKLGMIPELVQVIYDGRKIAKKTQFDYERRKVLINEIIKTKMKPK